MEHNFEISLLYFYYLDYLLLALWLIVSLASIYVSLQSHRLDFSIEVLKLIWLSMLFVPCASSFISIEFFVLNLVGWFGSLFNKFIIFLYSLLYYCIDIKVINNFLFYFWRYISFFKYFFIMLICNCFWIILLWIFWIFVILSSYDSATA